MDLAKNLAVEFIRPLGKVYMRVRVIKTGLKYNANKDDLQELNEMEVLAYMVDDSPEDEEGIEG
jgi:hypothetical protein